MPTVQQLANVTISGTTDDGASQQLSSTQEGHLEVALHDPLSVFGSVLTTSDIPLLQADFIYGINTSSVTTIVNGTGSVTAVNNMATCATGASSGSFGVLESRKRLRYRPGQGVKTFFTAMFTTPVVNSYQCSGIGTAECGVYFGYGDTNDLTNTSFGILYVNAGVREVKTLTVTTGATSASNATVTLNGTGFTVALTAATNIQRTVWELSQGTYTGWDAYPSGATVVFVSKSAGLTAGTQTYTAGTTGSVATIAQTKAGVTSTDTFISQSDWNGDKLDGTGTTAFVINPQKLNIYRINIGYLGAHDIQFQVKVTPASGNNSTWITCHTIKKANLITTPTFSNPSFPFNTFAYSAGSTTNLTVSTGSFAGFIEGMKMLNGPRASFLGISTTVTSALYHSLFTIINPRYYAGKTNQTVINVLSLVGALKHTSPCIFYIIKNGALVGNPAFTLYGTDTCALWDTAATSVTFTDNSQILYTDHLGDTGDLDHKFGNGEFNAEELTLQPGDWITVAAKSTTGSPAYVTAGLNTREDQ